ncbi:ABC transporter ATP-binding protein [Clostridia bacterium]|nr:ABC transporter ATP-binding protein [Clostridia bacterium]
MNADTILEVKDLYVSFFTYAGEVKAVRGISYTLEKGAVLGIVGESGSGKSVSSFAVMGIVPEPGRVTGGSIRFMGKELTTLSEREFQSLRGGQIGMIFQDPMTSLDAVYTVGSQIDESLKKHTKLDRAARYARQVELMELVGINEPRKRLRQYPHELSGGMRQRVMIAMALACNPDILIADEPTTALDVTIQRQILDLLRSVQDRLGTAIVLITHDLGVVAEICDRVAVMYGGIIVETGTRTQIFYQSRHPYTWGLLKSLPNLDDDEHTRLIPIDGNPVDLMNPPAGCPFAPRCRHCLRVCLQQMPPVCMMDEGHQVACWLTVKEDLGLTDSVFAKQIKEVGDYV